MINNILVLGPKCSGKTSFIYTLLKIKIIPTVTIGADMYVYKYSNTKKIYLWDIGNGLYYNEVINPLLIKVNTIIIIENKKNIDFIKKTILYIKNYYSIKNIIIIFNLIDYNNNLINNFNNLINKYIESLDLDIKFNIFSIDCNKYEEVKNIISFIKNNIPLY